MKGPQDQVPGLERLTLEPTCQSELWVSSLKNHYLTQGDPGDPTVPTPAWGTKLSLLLLLQIQSYTEHGHTYCLLCQADCFCFQGQ